MSEPRDRFAKIRSSMEAGRQVLTQTRGRAGDQAAVFARASLERVEITEEYFVEQVISVSPSIGTAREPRGSIELSVPFDGRDYFTRQARDDVARAITTQPPADGKATIGHLLFQDYDRSDLGGSLQLPANNGAIAIKIPVTGGLDSESSPDLGMLIGDRQTCVLRHGFLPESPLLIPAKFDIQLFDPDSLDLPSLDPIDAVFTVEGRRQILNVVRKIREQVTFQNELVLRVVVLVSVPAKVELPAKPVVRRMTIAWPVITSPQALTLRVDNRKRDDDGNVVYDIVPIRYNPEGKCLEWSSVDMYPAGGDDATRNFISATMLLSIQHLGELYEIQHPGEADELQVSAEVEDAAEEDAAESGPADEKGFLRVDAEVEIAEYLLSGLSTRLFDATGHKSADPKPLLTTLICAAANLKLDDAFAKRIRSPYQHLFFDEIIPEEMRITDILKALEDRGFEARVLAPTGQVQLRSTEARAVNWLLGARRPEGPDNMYLWIFVEGRHFETERQRTTSDGGVTHTTKRDSGELRVYMRGTLERDSGKVVREMNALQRALRERFARVRAQT